MHEICRKLQIEFSDALTSAGLIYTCPWCKKISFYFSEPDIKKLEIKINLAAQPMLVLLSSELISIL